MSVSVSVKCSPILIMCLLADRDTLLCSSNKFSGNCTFIRRCKPFSVTPFCLYLLLDKQCVIETHSEYLINLAEISRSRSRFR